MGGQREEHALRLVAADELLQSGGAPDALLKAQGLDPAALEVLKYSGQPRVPAGNGRESGQYTYGQANVTPAAFRRPKERRGHRGSSAFDAIRSFLEWLRERRAPKPVEPAPEEPLSLDEAKPAIKPAEIDQSSDLDPNKLHHIFDKKGRELDEFISRYDNGEAAFGAIEDATRKAITEQKITGQYKIQIEIDGYKLGVAGKVMPDGTVKIGTAYPWKD